MTNAQRALWTFLFFTLVGPFLAAVAVLLGSAVLAAIGNPARLEGGTAVAQLSPPALAIQAFALGAFVAAIAGASLAAATSLRGNFSWLQAAIAGVVSFMMVALGSGAIASSNLTLLAFLSGSIALACRAMLVRIGLLPAD